MGPEGCAKAGTAANNAAESAAQASGGVIFMAVLSGFDVIDRFCGWSIRVYRTARREFGSMQVLESACVG